MYSRVGTANTPTAAARPDAVTVFLSGDVMLGRGIDQILPYPSDPRLYEPFMKSAEEYLALAERAHGPIPRSVDPLYIWGDAAAALGQFKPDLRIINLETSITSTAKHFPKGINYRMSPENARCLTAMGIDCCILANNHVMDWTVDGLLETLASLRGLSIAYAGAGPTRDEAKAPAILHARNGRRVLIFGFGMTSCGIPLDWAAQSKRPGVNLLEADIDRAMHQAVADIKAARKQNDLVVASIHWGSNWGYDISHERKRLAHALIDAEAADIVHGHSAHHPQAIEIYRGKLILYGCGDFVNDYEGIGGYAEYRSDLTLAYLVTCSPTGSLLDLAMVPFQVQKFRLNRATEKDALWLQQTLDRESAKLGTHIMAGADRTLRVIPT